MFYLYDPSVILCPLWFNGEFGVASALTGVRPGGIFSVSSAEPSSRFSCLQADCFHEKSQVRLYHRTGIGQSRHSLFHDQEWDGRGKAEFFSRRP